MFPFFVVEARSPKFDKFLESVGVYEETTMCGLFWSTIGTGLDNFSSSQNWFARAVKTLLTGFWWMLMAAIVLLGIWSHVSFASQGKLGQVGFFWLFLVGGSILMLLGGAGIALLIYLGSRYACPVKIKRKTEDEKEEI